MPESPVAGMPEWHADGHTVQLVVDARILLARAVCPHDPAEFDADPIEQRPACLTGIGWDDEAEPYPVALEQCAVVAAAGAWRDEELWFEGTPAFEVAASPFAVEWAHVPDEGVWIRPAAGAVKPLDGDGVAGDV